MEKNQQPQAAPKLDVVQLLKLCVKSWKAFVACVAACLLIAGFYLLTRQPSYEVNASLKLPPETSTGGGLLALTDMASSFSMGDMFGGSSTENEIASIRSVTVFEKAVRELGLNTAYFEKYGFMDWRQSPLQHKLLLTEAPSIPDTLRAPILFTINQNSKGTFNIEAECRKETIYKQKNVELPAVISLPFGDFTLEKTANFDKGEPVTRFRILFSSYVYMAQDYIQNVKVFAPNKKTDFITMSYITSNTKFGKLLLNTIIDSYNQMGVDQKNDKSGANLTFIDNRIERLEGELAQSETAMEKFKEQNNITDPAVDASTIMQKATIIQGEVLEAQTENEILRMTLDFLSDSANNYSLIPMLGGSTGENDNALNNVPSYNQMILDRMRVKSQVKVDSPTLLVLNAQIDEMRDNIINAMKRALVNSDVKLRDLKRENDLTVSRINGLPKIEKEYVTLERDLYLKQQLYLFLLKQREETQMSLDKSSPSLITVDPPYVLIEIPGLSKKMVILIAIFLGLCAAFAWVFYIVMPKAPLPKAKSIAEMELAPVAGTLADTGAEKMPVLVGNEGESIRVLRSNVVPMLQSCKGNAVMVASAVSGEGKTYVATNLAAALGLAGNKVALVDANLRNPQCAAVAGKLQGVTVMALDASGANPADVLSSPATAERLKELKQEYDYVVIDTPAVEDYSDAFALAEAADMTLFVARVGLSTRRDVNLASQLLQQGRLPRIAAVING